MLTAGNSVAQSLVDTTLKVSKTVDVMEGKTTYFFNKSLLVSDDGTKGFVVLVSLTPKGDGFGYGGLIVRAAGIGTCHENSYLTVLFDDGTKAQMNMWNDFNCQGKIYMDLYSRDLSKLNKPIDAIRLTNGRTFENFTMTITGVEKYYFMDCIHLINSQQQ